MNAVIAAIFHAALNLLLLSNQQQMDSQQKGSGEKQKMHRVNIFTLNLLSINVKKEITSFTLQL